MGKVLAALLVLVVTAEIVVALVIAGVLLWLGAPQTMGLGAAVLVASAAACIMAIRFVRAGQPTVTDEGWLVSQSGLLHG